VLNNGSGKSEIRTFANVLPRRVAAGLYKAGLVIESQSKKLLSGPGRKTGPNDNPYPGVVTGTLRRSVTTVGEATRAIIGPGGLATPYAAIHEFGGRAGRGGSAVIPARPYMGPSLDQAGEKAFDVLWKVVTAP
jgi:phage gpG-like protein